MSTFGTNKEYEILWREEGSNTSTDFADPETSKSQSLITHLNTLESELLNVTLCLDLDSSPYDHTPYKPSKVEGLILAPEEGTTPLRRVGVFDSAPLSSFKDCSVQVVTVI